MGNKSKKKDERSLSIKQNNDLEKNAIEIGASAIGALVGFAIGGPAGAVIGSITSPTVSVAQNIIYKAIERRKTRLKNIVVSSMDSTGMRIDDALLELSNNDKKADELFSLLSLAVSSDKALDCVFSGLIAEVLQSNSTQENDRVLIIGDAVKNLRSIHLKIISALYSAGGILSASEIAKAVDVPEIELRSVVRDLELRGIILDLGKDPVEWKLRKLGQAISLLIQDKREEK